MSRIFACVVLAWVFGWGFAAAGAIGSVCNASSVLDAGDVLGFTFFMAITAVLGYLAGATRQAELDDQGDDE